MTFSRTTPPMDYLTTSTRAAGSMELFIYDLQMSWKFLQLETLWNPLWLTHLLSLHEPSYKYTQLNNWSSLRSTHSPAADDQIWSSYLSKVKLVSFLFCSDSTQIYMKTTRTTFTTVLYGNTAFVLCISVDLLRWKWIQWMFFCLQMKFVIWFSEAIFEGFVYKLIVKVRSKFDFHADLKGCVFVLILLLLLLVILCMKKWNNIILSLQQTLDRFKENIRIISDSQIRLHSVVNELLLLFYSSAVHFVVGLDIIENDS